MALDFPTNPSDGDIYQTYVYNGTIGVWEKLSSAIKVSDTAPDNPVQGTMWWKSSTGALYVRYGSVWVAISGPTGAAGADGADGGAVQYASKTNFPTSGNTLGQFVIAQDTKALYVWDGIEWDRVSSGAQSLPEWTTQLNSSYRYNIATDSASTITVEATDPDGFPINYGFTTDSANPASATITQGTGANSNQFTITPDSATTGEFLLRVTADDGVNKIKSLSTITIFNSALLDLSGGTGGQAGQSVYTAPSGAVVTASDTTYSNPPNYYLEYLFDGVTDASGYSYWLSNSASSGTLTVDLSNQVTNGIPFGYLEKIVVYPYSRTDTFSSVTAVETSSDGTNWTAVTGWTWGTYTAGQSEEITINRNATYVRLSLSRSGMWGLSMAELEIWGA